MVVNYNDIINAIAQAEDVALYNARARAIELSNGCKPSKADDDKAIEIESWIQLLTRAAETIDEDTCLDDDIIWEIIQNINELNRDVDCDVSRTYSRHSSSGGGSNVPSGYVERVLGVNVDNTNPSNPIVTIYVDGITITGDGTQGNPFVAVGGGGGAVWGTIAGVLSNQTDLQNALNAKVTANSAITGATKTKITYDAKGLVTAGADATTTDIAEGTNLYYTNARGLTTVLTGFSAGAGTVAATDTILQALNKIVGNLALKQDTLVSTVNIKTINGSSILGAGDLVVSGGGITKATAAGTDTYTATISGVAAYVDGDTYLIRFTNGNTTAATLNINSLGAKSLYRNNDGAIIGGDIWDGGEMLCVYNSALAGFQCIGTSPNSIFAYITNDDSVAITKGQVVYAFGGIGDRMTVKLANNTSDATSARTVGVVLSTSIAANQKGIIILQGLLDGLSTLGSPFAHGDSVYLGTTNGSITNVKQYAPNHLVSIGTVTTASNGSAGRMYVKIQNGYELDELHNVQAQSPSLNDTLYYDNAVSPAQWKTASIATILGYTPISATSTDTLTNKRITARTGTVASDATPTINTDNVDFFSITAQTVDITSFTTNLSGTPTEGQTLWIAITGTAARAIAWGASFESSTITLPTTTVTTDRLDVAFIWNSVSSKWRCVGVA